MVPTPSTTTHRLLVISLLATVGAPACRTTDEARVAHPPTVNRSVTQTATTDVARIPGGRPGGLGDPRRYPTAQGATTVNPAGTYELSATDDGKPMTVAMVISGTPGTFTGRIKSDTRPEVQISTVTASGPLVTVTADVPNGVLLFRFRLTGDSVHGDWSLRGDGGRVVGTRQASKDQKR